MGFFPISGSLNLVFDGGDFGHSSVKTKRPLLLSQNKTCAKEKFTKI